MEHFDALSHALEGWFDHPLCDLPGPLHHRVVKEFFPMPWDTLSASQRRSLALQLDYQNDPATAQDRKFWWEFSQRVDGLKVQIKEWEAAATPTAAELATKETRLAELRHELALMDAQQRSARGDYFPERKAASKKQDARNAGPSVRYVAYPKAMQQLAKRLGASPEELAAWIWTGPEDGGIAAYVNANELVPPPRFSYSYFVGTSDYIAPLMGCWFKADDVEQFEPTDRYIVGAALIERWSKRPGLHAVAFIHAKIAESRLLDIHPIYGGTRGTFSEHPDWPPLESGLFEMARVLQIEAEDFAEFGAAESGESHAQPTKRRSDNPRTQAIAKPGDVKENRGSTVRREARKLDTQAMYKQWQKAYAAAVRARPNMSDLWYSQHIAKMEIAKKRSAETIRKNMKR